MQPPGQSPSGSILGLIPHWEGEPLSGPANQTRLGIYSGERRAIPRWLWNGDWHMHMAAVEFRQLVERRTGDHYCVGGDGFHEMPRADEVQSIRRRGRRAPSDAEATDTRLPVPFWWHRGTWKSHNVPFRHPAISCVKRAIPDTFLPEQDENLVF